jgi:arsenate reductase
MEDNKKSVLFICVYNSARSQMAEELLRKYGGEGFSPESAGLEPGKINPRVIRALKEDEDIDISRKKTQGVMDLFKAGRLYHTVVTVCGAAEEEGCPVFPGITNRLHWPFDDPSRFTGTDDEIADRVHVLLRQIKEKILEFITAERGE